MAVRIDKIGRLDDTLSEGFVPSYVFSDEEIYDFERENIFGKEWIFLAHESEIPEAGDYVVRYICDSSFIVVRDESDEVHVLANTCRHQGMTVCRTERGNSSHFRCAYHGWTYRNDGELVGVPFEQQAYGDEGVTREEFGLHPAPGCETYHGMVFANLDPDAPPLEEFLGDFAWYLDFFTGRGENGVEFNGPQRRIIDANWKIPILNSIGDKYHVGTTHYSVGMLDITGSGKDADEVEEFQVAAGAGGLNLSPRDMLPNYPEALRESIARSFSSEHLGLLDDIESYPSDGALFPNLTFLNLVARPEPDEAIPFTYIRTVRPMGPEKTEVFTWHVVEKDAPKEFKEMAKKAFTFCFGASGTLTQDDIENWTRITDASHNAVDNELNFSMGMDSERESDWKYPGTAYRGRYSEANARHYFEMYRNALESAGGSE